MHRFSAADRVDLARTAWGALLCTQPSVLVEAAGGPPTHRALVTARVLGARHLLQAGALAASRLSPALRASSSQRVLRRLAAGVDGSHALSAVVLAAAGVARRPWLEDAAVATAFARATWRTATP